MLDPNPIRSQTTCLYAYYLYMNREDRIILHLTNQFTIHGDLMFLLYPQNLFTLHKKPVYVEMPTDSSEAPVDEVLNYFLLTSYPLVVFLTAVTRSQMTLVKSNVMVWRDSQRDRPIRVTMTDTSKDILIEN